MSWVDQLFSIMDECRKISGQNHPYKKTKRLWGNEALVQLQVFVIQLGFRFNSHPY
jgi:hypothetical protein